MGIFSNLARKIVNKDDDEAVEIIRRKMAPPPARPIVTDPDPTPIVSTMPALPTRVPMADLGPAPGTGEYAIAQMEEILKNQPQGNYSNATIGPTGAIEGVTFRDKAPPLPIRNRTTATVDGVPPPPVTEPYMAPPMPRVFVGEEYKGMNPMQRAQTHLRVLRSADPSSKVRDTGEGYEVLPPQKMGRLEGAGRGLLTLMPAGASGGWQGMLGSGLFGAGLGAIAPGKIQELARKREIAQAQGEYATELGLEGERTTNESRRLANLTSLERLQDADQDRSMALDRELRLEYTQGLDNINEMQKKQSLLDPRSPQYAEAEKAIAQEAERLSKRTGRRVTVIPGNPKLNQLPRIQVGNEVLQQQHDGTLKVIYSSPKIDTDADVADQKATYEWQIKNQENEAKRTAAQQEAQAMVATGDDHLKKVQTIATQISALDAKMAKMSARDPELGPLKRQREQMKQQQASEQRNADDAYRKAREKEAEAVKYPTMPPPPKRARRGNGANGVQKLSRSAWEASHPGQDWNLAVQEANKRGIQIIP